MTFFVSVGTGWAVIDMEQEARKKANKKENRNMGQICAKLFNKPERNFN
jgi:hypothetical protein